MWNGRELDFTLNDDSEVLTEVVVTALGIKREAKSLAYAAQTVGGKDVNEIKNINMINSLQGKSAGLSITPNSTGAGGASKILFRGSKSISGSNQPLIVLDGVPLMMNISDSQVSGNYGGGHDGGAAMSTINPDDIAQITLLKGASAAALYGAVAANGAIMITTKSAQAGKVGITVSSNTTMETAAPLAGATRWVLQLKTMPKTSSARASPRTIRLLSQAEQKRFLLISPMPMCALTASHRATLTIATIFWQKWASMCLTTST